MVEIENKLQSNVRLCLVGKVLNFECAKWLFDDSWLENTRRYFLAQSIKPQVLSNVFQKG